MRHGDTTILKRFAARLALPVAIFLALVLPVGAGAAVKLDADDVAVRIPTAVFGKQTAARPSSQAFVDDHDDKEHKEKKCKEHKEDCSDESSELAEPEAPPVEQKTDTEEVPEASWSG